MAHASVNLAVSCTVSNRHSTQYINYRCKKNLFYCCYLCLLNGILSFLHKVIDLKPIFVPLSTKGYRYACVCALMVVKQW